MNLLSGLKAIFFGIKGKVSPRGGASLLKMRIFLTNWSRNGQNRPHPGSSSGLTLKILKRIVKWILGGRIFPSEWNNLISPKSKSIHKTLF